ncbi:MAG: carboxypeptidase-like regulatory domain-containing protein [Candidatus Marinimicrobia bacterium]|nr:carboxypeptidase-like regulatory domain-containing protein [bacterium]MCG2716145.1 carboxypeptidase-like regulatory domain-containing protein [Candidatus Neomarinimicrobiota bacterium]
MRKSIIPFIVIFILVTLSCDKDILSPKSISLATLKGNVIESVNQMPLSEVTVSVSNYTESVQTDSMGQYTLQVELETSTSSEQVTLITWKLGYVSSQIGYFTIKANKTVLIPTIPMDCYSYMAGVSGNVIDTTGSPLDNVLISLSNHAVTSFTDNNGEFSFSVEISNPTENVTVIATKPFYQEAQYSVTLEYDQTTVVPTFVLKLLP